MVNVVKKTPTKFAFTDKNHPWIKNVVNGIATLSIPDDCAHKANTCVIVNAGLDEAGGLNRWLGYANGKTFVNIVDGADGVKEVNGMVTFQITATSLNNKLVAPNTFKATTTQAKSPSKAKA